MTLGSDEVGAIEPTKNFSEAISTGEVGMIESIADVGSDENLSGGEDTGVGGGAYAHLISLGLLGTR